MPPSVADLVAEPRHACALEGATATGRAQGGERLVVHVGVWTGPDGRVRRARYRATTCAALIAYAEAACALAETEGAPPRDAASIRAAVAGVHPLHRGRADLVALAFARAASPVCRSEETAR